jgi:hypothetical protein
MRNRLVLSFVLVFAAAGVASGQGQPLFPAVQQAPAEKPATPERAEVLVLGVYHMANRVLQIWR